MASHHRNHHRSASMAASTSAASSSSHNNNFATTTNGSSGRHMNHPNHSTASIHVSNPSTTASGRIRQLWQAFERTAANGRSTMEHKINAATSKADADYKKMPIQQRTLTPSQHEERKVKLAKEIKEGYFDSVRTDWLARLSGAGLNPEEWTDMTENEMRSVATVLGAEEEEGAGEDSDGSIEESDEELVFVQNKTGFSMSNAPSMMSASMRSSNISTSTTSSYAVVNPSEFHLEDGDADYFLNPASVMATSHDLTSDDDDGYTSQSHHSHASYTHHTTASNQFGPWSHNASTDSLNSSHSNHNAGYFSAASSTSASRPAPLTSTASYSQQSHQNQPNTPRNATFPPTSGSTWAATQNQKLKSNSQYSSSAYTAASNPSGASSKLDSGAMIAAPKPRQVYIGPHLLDDESGAADPTNPGSNANDAGRENDDATGFSSDEEADFEVFKMRTRMLKIVEFHQAAALAEIKLAVGIYEDRRKALPSASASAAAKAPSSVSPANAKGKNGKSKTNENKENVDGEDFSAASRSAGRVSISARLADHEKKMIELQKEKEEERKEMVREERRKRRGEIELKKQLTTNTTMPTTTTTVSVNGPTLNGVAGKGRGRSGTATASTPAIRRGSISAISGGNTNNNINGSGAAPITSSAPNNTGNMRGRPGRSGTLIGTTTAADNSRTVPPASAPTPAPMPAPKASAPVHPAWLENFNADEEEEGEEEEDEEKLKGLEEPFDLDKLLSGENSVESLLGNMLGPGGREKGKNKQSPPTQRQPPVRTGMSSASSSAASSVYNGSMGGKRRMSDAASIASGMSTASGMANGRPVVAKNRKSKIRAPSMQKKPSLFGDSDDEDNDEDGDGESESEDDEESTSPSPPGEYYSMGNADAILASELMQDPITAAQIQHYLSTSAGGGGGGKLGGMGRGSASVYGNTGMGDGMDDGLGALAAEFGVAGIMGGMGMGGGVGKGGRESAFGGGGAMGMMPGGLNDSASSSGFGYESWGIPPTTASKLMAASSTSSQNSTTQSLWGNQGAANSTTNLGLSNLHAPVATPPTLASNLLSSKGGAGRATPMPKAPTPGGWKRLGGNGNSGVGRSAPTPQPQLQSQAQIPGFAPHQAQAFLQSQLQVQQQQQAQFAGYNSPNMNDPYALAAAALEASLNGNHGAAAITGGGARTTNPYGNRATANGSGSGYASSSGNGYLSSSSAMGGSRNKSTKKKISPFGSDDDDDDDDDDNSGSAGVWGSVMNAGMSGKGKKPMMGSSMMGSMMNPFASQSQQQQQEDEEEAGSMWGAPTKKVPAKSAVNGKKFASSSIMNINASASNAKALKEKLDRERAEKERAEKERLEKEKEELEKAKAAAAVAEKEKAAQPPTPALTASMSKKQNKKQKQAAKKGGATAVSPEPEPEPKEPTPPPSPPSLPPPEPSAISLMSRILPGKGRGRKESVSVLSPATPALSGATASATISSATNSNASAGGLFGSWDEKDNSSNTMSNSFSSMSVSTPRQTSKVPASIFGQQQQQQTDEFGASGFGFGTPKQGNVFKSSASGWGSAMNANTSSTIRASAANSGTNGKGSLWGMFGGGGDKSASASQSSSFSIPGGFDDVNDPGDDGDGGGGGNEGKEESKMDEWEESGSAWGMPTAKKGVSPPVAVTKPAVGAAAQRLRRMSEATSTSTPPPAPVPEPSPPAPSPAITTNAGGKKGKGKKGAKGANNNTSPVIPTANGNNKSLKPTIEVVPDEDDDQVRGEILPSDSKHIMEDADGNVGLDLVGSGVKEVLGGDEKRVEALMKELRESEAKLGGMSGAGAGAGKTNVNANANKSPWGAKSTTESVFGGGAKGTGPTPPAATSTPVWGQAARRGKAGAGGKLF